MFCISFVVKMTDTDEKKGDEGQSEPVYGGCEGPNAMYVKLISSDDHEFIINRDYALTSGTIKAMLSGPGKTLLSCNIQSGSVIGKEKQEKTNNRKGPNGEQLDKQCKESSPFANSQGNKGVIIVN